MILLDTHVVIWMAEDDPRLGAQSRSIILAARDDGGLAISAISFWEIALLISKARLQIASPPAEMRIALLDSGVTELPLTGDIALLAVELDGLHGDPADRFIAATAIAHAATLMTADDKLLRWPHRLSRQDAAE